eukprot:maker-scaffold_13-snap-gene-0.41-mRNA-1 protein AED:0.03 eAED:0.03 QI:31/1/1/1/1/1/5/80/661
MEDENDYVVLPEKDQIPEEDIPNQVESIFKINLTPKIDDFRGKGSSIRRLISLSYPERFYLFIGLIALTISSFASMLLPAMFGQLASTLSVEPGNKEQREKAQHDLNQTVLFLVILFSLNSIFGMIRGSMFNLSGERLVARFRVRVFSHLLSQDVSFFDESKAGELQSRLSNDVTTLQDAVTSNVSVFLRYVGQVVASIVILFTLSWKLTVVMLSIVPIMAILARVYGNFVHKLSKKYQKQLAEASQTSEEVFQLIRTVKSFSNETVEQQRFMQKILGVYKLGEKKALAYGIFIGLIGLAAYLSIAVVLWYGGIIVLRDQEMTAAQLTSFVLYTLYIATAVAALSGLFSQINVALGASQRLFEILDTAPKIVSDIAYEEVGINGKSSEKEIASGKVTRTGVNFNFEDVSFAYPSRKEDMVLKKMCFSVEAGKLTALVGASGGGKSTCIALLLRFYDPLSGRISTNYEAFGGTPSKSVSISTIGLSKLRSVLGIVSQEPPLFAGSLRSNISYGKQDATMAEIEAAARAAFAHEFIIGFPDGYDTEVGERGVQLSGGQKQRVALARAFLKINTSEGLLLLDEATSALDSESEKLVQSAIENKIEKGMGCLVIAHRLATVKKADKIVVIDAGTVSQEGTHEELLESGGIYKNMVEKQKLHNLEV